MYVRNFNDIHSTRGIAFVRCVGLTKKLFKNSNNSNKNRCEACNIASKRVRRPKLASVVKPNRRIKYFRIRLELVRVKTRFSIAIYQLCYPIIEIHNHFACELI